MTTATKHPIHTDLTVDELVHVVHNGLATLREDGAIEDIPEDGFAEAILRAAFTDRPSKASKRTGHAHHLRIRTSVPKAGTELVPDHAFRNLVFGFTGTARWLQGSGNLEGLFIARSYAGTSYEEITTLATLVLVLSGRRSSACAAWARTGLVGWTA